MRDQGRGCQTYSYMGRYVSEMLPTTAGNALNGEHSVVTSPAPECGDLLAVEQTDLILPSESNGISRTTEKIQ